MNLSGPYALTPGHWAASWLIGNARRWSHEGNRATTRDRGADNSSVDMLGALGEVLAYTRLRDDPVAGPFMRRNMVVKREDVSGCSPDFVVWPAIGVDAKVSSCVQRNRYFAINEKKHAALSGGAWYMCVLTKPLASRAYAQMVRREAVCAWPCFDLGGYGDPSRNIEMSEFCETYAPRCSIGHLRGAPEFSWDRVRDVIPSVFGRMSDVLPTEYSPLAAVPDRL